MGSRRLVVTIDTEVDCDRQWRVSDPPAFRSVTDGIPAILTPLFERYGVRPTYLISGEVMEEPACVEALRRLDNAELGTHLHAEFVEPQRRLFRETMGGAVHDALQCQYPREVEAAKLERLTRLFETSFGRRPTAFRAGRYGMSGHTLALLAGLGYQVDSSVTPGIRWDYVEGVVDYREWRSGPAWIDTPHGTILELPITIRPSGRFAAMVGLARTRWLRPSWASGRDLVRLAQTCPDETLVMMMHSNEMEPGASPYAADAAGVRRIAGAMETLFKHWGAQGQAFCTMTEAAHAVPAAEPVAV